MVQQSTLTIDELGAALRLTTGEPVEEPTRAILERQLLVAEGQVDRYAPSADPFTREEAIIRMVGYLFDGMMTALNNAPAQHSFAMSGAKAILSGYHVSPGVIV